MEQKDDMKLELARLEALANEGVDLNICGRRLKMKALPFMTAQAIKNRLVEKLGSGLGEASGLSKQIDLAFDEVLDIIVEIFKPTNPDVTRQSFETISEPELRMIWLAFKRLNEGIVGAITDFLSPIFQQVRNAITESISTARRS